MTREKTVRNLLTELIDMIDNGSQRDLDRADEIVASIIKLFEQEPVLDKINKMKFEIADSLEFWDYSPNNNPLARDMLETITNFWGDMREVKE